VRIYPAAQNDLKEIVAQAALRYYDLLVEKIGSLSELPEPARWPRILSYGCAATVSCRWKTTSCFL
jgi:hypothetical protein